MGAESNHENLTACDSGILIWTWGCAYLGSNSIGKEERATVQNHENSLFFSYGE